MEGLADWINSSLNEINHEQFKDVVKVEVDVKDMGDGQVLIISEIKRVILTLVTSKGEKRHVKAVAKVEAPEGPGRLMATDTGAFIMEIKMYSEILPSMESVMAEITDKDYIWPECYLTKDNKFLLQDLCDVGYKIVPTYKFLDADHTLLVMKGIGKFHALSLVLKERGLLDPNAFGEPFFVSKNPALEHMQRKSIEDFAKAVLSWGPEWVPIMEKLTKYFGNISEKARELWETTKGEWVVLNHGDFTMRNMMFHYQPESTKPDGIKFIDFQMCHHSSFAFDLSMILYSSLMPSVRDGNMAEFLSAYTDSFVSTCKTHNYKGPMLTLDMVNKSLKSLHNMSNAMALFQLPFFIASQNDDIQKRTDEFVQNYSNVETIGTQGSPMVDYSDPACKALIQSELRRCMNENCF